MGISLAIRPRIEASRRPLPIGYWKGSGLALMLDMVGGRFVGRSGNSSNQSGRTARNKLSQTFISFDLRLIDKDAAMAELVNQIIEFAQATNSLKSESVRIRVSELWRSDERIWLRASPVEPEVWEQIQRMSDEL